MESSATNNFFDNKTFSDSILRLHAGSVSRILHVSRWLLASESPYFNQLFSNGMKETRQDVVDLHLDDQPSIEYFCDTIRCVYKEKQLVTPPENIMEVIRVADRFAFPCAVNRCMKTLKTEVTSIKNASIMLSIPEHMRVYSKTNEVLQIATEFIQNVFQNIRETMSNRVQRQELLDLTPAAMLVVLKNDKLKIDSVGLV